MALITCPDCGKEHSDLAKACPNCGRPNGTQEAEKEKSESVVKPAAEQKKGGGSGCLTVLGIMFILPIPLVAIGLVFYSIQQQKIGACNQGKKEECQSLLNDSSFTRFEEIENPSFKEKFRQKQKKSEGTEKEVAWDRLSAKVFCEEPIKQILRDPSSYEFEAAKVTSTYGKDRQYGKAMIYFRTKNGFGGYNRSTATCESYDKGGERWFNAYINE